MRGQYFIFPLFLMLQSPAFAQNTASGFSNVALKRGAQRVAFNIGKAGTVMPMRWGMDVAWDSEDNVKRGVTYIGGDNLTLGRASFQPSDIVTGGRLSDAQVNALRNRWNHLLLMGNKSSFDVIINCDHESLNTENYSPNYRANTTRWADVIDATTRQLQSWGANVIGVAPFNEPDYGTGLSWGWKEGNQQDFLEIAKALKEHYTPTFDSISIVGGNTLNCDNALSWYNTLKDYLGMGNTHQLAGSFDSYANFFTQVTKDGKIGLADELHNVGEAIVGQQYGATMGIWWGFDGVARGQFCRATSSKNPGERLAYAEDRPSWTSAAVYRNAVDGGVVEAFLGTSERQATNHSYEFLSLDRDVYYDGRGPLRQFIVDMPGGTGYQKGQTNAEKLVNIQYGEDVPRREIADGKYIIMNRNTRQVLQPSAGVQTIGNTVTTARRSSGNSAQEWTISPVDSRVGGDFSYVNIKSDTLLLDNLNWSLTSNTNAIIYNGDGGNVEQWYLKYAGNGYYYIINRHSGMYLCKPSSSSTVVQQPLNTTARNNYYQQWRIMPVTNNCEILAPSAPTELKVRPQSHSIALSWTASTSSDVCGYNILRATGDADDWNTIARNVAGTDFVDNSVSEGVAYRYKVRALDKGDNLSTQASNEASASTLASKTLIANWTMNETLADSTDNRLDASLYGDTTFVDGRKNGTKALSLNGTTNYLQLPYSVGSMDEMTFSAWVNVKSSRYWQRIFDFGNNTDQYFFLTPNNGQGQMRFAIKNGGDEEQVNVSSPALNQWVNVVVTIGNGKVAIWLDGEKKGEAVVNTKPSDIRPVMNFVGRSQFTGDPVLSASIEDVRLYNYVLGDDEIARLYNGTLSGIKAVKNSASSAVEYYDLSGKKQTGKAHGVTIEKSSNGSTRKVIER